MKKDIKIAITGAGGFLGKSALEYFSGLPHIAELRVLYSQPMLVHEPHPKIRVFLGDLREQNIARDLVHGVDAVLHFANKGTPSETVLNPPRYLEHGLSVTGTLLEAMVTEKVSRIIYASSGTAIYRYDPLRKVPFHEGSDIEFRSAFALAKITTEQMLQYYKKNHGISPVALRLSNPFGQHQMEIPFNGFIGDLFSKVQKGEEVKIYGNLEVVKDFIYIDDVLRVLDGFLQHPEQTGVFNVASGMGVSLREIVTNMERLAQRKVRISFSPFAPTDVPWTVLNTSKVQRALNWTCRHSLQDGIRLMWDRVKATSKEPPLKKAA